MFIDSHCHPYMLDLSLYDNDFNQWVSDTICSGVDAMVSVGIDQLTSQQSIALAEKYDCIYATTGFHPSEKEENDGVDAIIALANHSRVVGIGETGLDYFYRSNDSDFQRNRFRNHIRAARQIKKPLIIHSRDAKEDTLKLLREEKANKIGGVMHCFTEDAEMAKAAIDMGFYISFSGIITFKNAKALQSVVLEIPLENILIETDAPYLAPTPYRGKQNEPKYVHYVAEKIAELKEISTKSVATVTTNNFKQLFRLP